MDTGAIVAVIHMLGRWRYHFGGGDIGNRGRSGRRTHCKPTAVGKFMVNARGHGGVGSGQGLPLWGRVGVGLNVVLSEDILAHENELR
jgi:hypothetical protein